MTAESRNSLTNRCTIATQRRGKYYSAVTNKHATIEEILEAVFSMLPVLRIYDEDISRVDRIFFGTKNKRHEVVFLAFL
jgi:hypothetical protein